MAITQYFKDSINKGDVRSIRITMSDSLLVDRTFEDFSKMETLAKNVPGLYDNHDGKDIIDDKSLWTEDYMDKLMVQVIWNFSKERLFHLKKVVRYLRPYIDGKKKEREYKKEKGSYNASKEIRDTITFIKSLEKQIFELDNDLKDISKSLEKAESAYNKENTEECKTSIDNLKNQKEYITKKLNILNSGLGKYHEVITELSNNK